MADNPYVPPIDKDDSPGSGRGFFSSMTTRQNVCFGFSLLFALGYGLAYWQHSIGVSPFHISRRLPGVDWIVLAITVVAPLLIGIGCGLRSGRAKWYALSLYPIVVALSLF